MPGAPDANGTPAPHRLPFHDWNRDGTSAASRLAPVVDETLRDGLQGGVPRVPTVEEKLELLEHVAALGVREAVIGFPADDGAFRHALALARAVRERALPLRLGLLGRMKASDVEAIDRVRAGSGSEVSAWLFLGSSRLRRCAQRWDPGRLRAMSADGLARARELGLPVNFGLEDATRSEPEVIEDLVRVAARQSVETLTLCDTVGWLTPYGTRRVVRYVREILERLGAKTRLDFHGHSDRGLALANSMEALRAGADRVHGTGLGIGERSGNAPLDLLLLNLQLEGRWRGDLGRLADYCTTLAGACELKIRPEYPAFGRRAFQTQAGVHAAAIVKAEERCGPAASSLVYSAIDPRWFGREMEIRVGPASGRANVRHVLRRSGLRVSEETVTRILRRVRHERHVLSPDEVCAIAKEEG